MGMTAAKVIYWSCSLAACRCCSITGAGSPHPGVFNALFAVQSVSDLAYLWGGMRLPEGLSYADYAHRGAYPLIVTALATFSP